MTKEKLDTIAERSASSLKELIGELSDEIIAACASAFEQAEADETESVKITLSHSIVLDLAKKTQGDSLGVSVRHKSKISSEITDPNQSELPI